MATGVVFCSVNELRSAMARHNAAFAAPGADLSVGARIELGLSILSAALRDLPESALAEVLPIIHERVPELFAEGDALDALIPVSDAEVVVLHH